MNAQEVKPALLAGVGRMLRITIQDGVTQDVQIDSVDDEGFLHSGPGGGDPQDFWTRFEEVQAVQIPLGYASKLLPLISIELQHRANVAGVLCVLGVRAMGLTRLFTK